jgi:3-oxosteroid 1-dehydrogenase
MTLQASGQFNLVVVGSGAAGLVAAITASRLGLRPLIIEKADVWGGTTATSGGVLWVPGNHLMQGDGAS